MLRSVTRFCVVVACFARYLTELAVRRPETREARADWLHRFCRALLRGLEILPVQQGPFPRRGALISNHVSYLDILMFAATQPCVFVSKASVAQWPLIGWIATMAGTVFIRRGEGGSAESAAPELHSASDAGLPVVFFPEGTTTDGGALLPFHSGLLAQVLEAGQPVTPAFLTYTLALGNPGRSVEMDVAYWSKGSLFSHVWRLLGLRGIGCRMDIAPEPVHFSRGEQALEDRRGAAAEAREAVLRLAGRPLPATTDRVGNKKAAITPGQPASPQR